MKYSTLTYLILAVIFVLSAASYFVIPPESILRALAGMPGIGALIYALFRLMRDQAAYEKQLYLQERQFQFSIGAASHMANVAFDRHAEFCEKYIAEVHAAARTLFKEGDSPAALDHAWNLHRLREEAAVWLTDSIDQDLGEFEQALRELGANAHFIQKTTGDERYSHQRSMRIDQNFDEMRRILGLGGNKGDEISELSAIEALKKRVRRILSVEELTKIREYLVENANAVIRGT